MTFNTQTLILTLVIFFICGGALFFMYYLKDRRSKALLDREKLMNDRESIREQREFEERKYQMQRDFEERRFYEEREINKERQRYSEKQSENNQELLNKFKDEIANELSGINSGGYIVFDLPNDMRGMFADLLKGFEEFARLKGYNISFSVDTSIAHKLAFKFTLQGGGVNVSTQTIRKDITEYIEKINNGENFENIPIVISPEEHNLVSMTLKNRINFLQHNYNLEKNTRKHYESLITKISSSSNGFAQQPSIFIQTGGVNSPKNLLANNSQHVLLGQEILYENNSDNSDHSIISISNSFNKRKEQIVKLEELIKLIKEENEVDNNDKQILVANFDKIREEISEEELPDKSRIFKWLSNTKKVLENIVLTHHTTDAIHWIYENFNFILHQVK